MDHNKLGLDASLIEATRSIIEKNSHQTQEKLDRQLDEATVDTNKYSWGTMKVVHHGSSFSIPLHPEHHQAIAKLKDGQEHKFKDETGRHWSVRRKGDTVHFVSNGMKTHVPHSTMKEEVELELTEDQLNEIKVEHDRYIRSHGKKAAGTGRWMFTHKRMGDVNYDSEKDVHTVNGSFSDASKSAKEWAKKHGHQSVYVMESSDSEELDEAGPFSYGAKKPRKGSIAYDIMMKRKKQYYNDIRTGKDQADFKDNMVGNAKLTKEQLEEIEALATKHGLTKD